MVKDDTRAIDRLRPYGFDPVALERFRIRARDEGIVTEQIAVEPLAPEESVLLPALGSSQRNALIREGAGALRAGQTGVVILAGGMATRFGGVVKAVVQVAEGRTFLELAIASVRALEARSRVTIPVFVMTSFATDALVRAHIGERDLAPASVFPQGASLRLTPEGELFREADGSLSPYATGHGDLPAAMRKSGHLEAFRKAGGRWLVLVNVDNLGASIDPSIVALHRQHGQPITVEAVRAQPGDFGGVIARLGGRAQIVEGLRLPRGFDRSAFPFFNTNTFVVSAEELAEEIDLPYHRVVKVVDGREAIQFERLVGELTGALGTKILEVPREGPDARFLPVKEPQELARRLPNLLERLQVLHSKEPQAP